MSLEGDNLPQRSPLPVVSLSNPVPVEMNVSQSHDDLLKWHGTELFFVPIMMVIGIIGNLCVGYIYHFRWRSNTVTLVKRMLAGLDLASLMFAYPAMLYVTVRPRSPNFESTCIFIGFILLISAVASGMVLVIIAVDRNVAFMMVPLYGPLLNAIFSAVVKSGSKSLSMSSLQRLFGFLCICYLAFFLQIWYLKLCRLQKSGISSALSKKLFASSLVLALVLNIPIPWVFGKDIINIEHYNAQVVYCFIADDRNETVFIVWAIILGLVFISVTTVLIILYSHIVRTLINLSDKHDELKRRPSELPNTETLEKHKQSQMMRSTAKVFIAVTVVFFATYSPYFVTLILSLTAPDIEGKMGPTWKAVYDLAKLSPLINNVANPIIYSFDSEHFRKEVKKMLTFKAFQSGFFRRRALSVSAKSFEISHTSNG